MPRTKRDKKDDLYLKKEEESLSTISFLKALKENLDSDTAFKIAQKAFSKYMISYYEKVLDSTKEGSQRRFDRFREFYEDYAKKTAYLEIIESSPTRLQVKYKRCPFYEILDDLDMGDLAYAFCLSDIGFTEVVLPGVEFSREYEIARGGPYCDNSWEFKT